MSLPVEREHIKDARRALENLGLPPQTLEDAKLLATELVTNSIRHSGLRADDVIRFRAVWTGETLRVSVHDGFLLGIPPRLTGPILPSSTGISGWGLYLVDSVAVRWGVDQQEGCWFEL